jgi:hypothetical protein
VLFFFLAAVVVVTQQEEDGMTKAEIVKDLVHNWPELFDHQNPELNTCCLVMFVKFNLRPAKYKEFRFET